MSQEHLYSANFRIANPRGIETQFTVRTDAGPHELVSQVSVLTDILLSNGYGGNGGGEKGAGGFLAERDFVCHGIVVGHRAARPGAAAIVEQHLRDDLTPPPGRYQREPEIPVFVSPLQP